MKKIIKITDTSVFLGQTDGTFMEISIAYFDFPISVGDYVDVYQIGEGYHIMPYSSYTQSAQDTQKDRYEYDVHLPQNNHLNWQSVSIIILSVIGIISTVLPWVSLNIVVNTFHISGITLSYGQIPFFLFVCNLLMVIVNEMMLSINGKRQPMFLGAQLFIIFSSLMNVILGCYVAYVCYNIKESYSSFIAGIINAISSFAEYSEEAKSVTETIRHISGNVFSVGFGLYIMFAVSVAIFLISLYRARVDY